MPVTRPLHVRYRYALPSGRDGTQALRYDDEYDRRSSSSSYDEDRRPGSFDRSGGRPSGWSDGLDADVEDIKRELNLNPSLNIKETVRQASEILGQREDPRMRVADQVDGIMRALGL